MEIFVDVTEQDILNGIKLCSTHCALALGTRRATGAMCMVGYQKAYVERECPDSGRVRTIEYSLPATAEKFSHDFDKGLPVKPFSFVLEVPE